HARKAVVLGELGDLLGFRIRLAQIAIFSDVHTELDALALTPASFSVLEILFHNRGLTQTRLAHAVRLDRSSLVPLLDRLPRRGLIRRETSTTDRRHNHLFLSAKAAVLRANALKRVREHETRLSARLTSA